MRSRGRDLERAPGGGEAAHVGEVEGLVVGVVAVGPVVAPGRGGDRGPLRLALQAQEELAEEARRSHLHVLDQGRLGGVRLRDDDRVHATGAERVDEHEHPGHRPHRAVEPQLAQHADAVEHACGEVVLGGERTERDGELESRTGLAHPAGREVDGDASAGPLELRRQHRRAHALPRLADGGVGQSDDLVRGEAARDVDLDGDELTVDADQRGALDGREHGVHLRCEPRAGRDGGPDRGASTAPSPYRRGVTATLTAAGGGSVQVSGVDADASQQADEQARGRWRVDDFVASLAAASPHTRAAYARDVGQFVAWADRGGCPAPERLDHRTLRRYLAFLNTRGFARRSVARKAAALRSFLRYLHRHGVITVDPGRSLRAPKGEARLPRVPRRADAAALLDGVVESVADADATAGAFGAARPRGPRAPLRSGSARERVLRPRATVGGPG